MQGAREAAGSPVASALSPSSAKDKHPFRLNTSALNNMALYRSLIWSAAYYVCVHRPQVERESGAG